MKCRLSFIVLHFVFMRHVFVFDRPVFIIIIITHINE